MLGQPGPLLVSDGSEHFIVLVANTFSLEGIIVPGHMR